MSALSGIYGRVTRVRRAWYQPHRQRRLHRPVVSVGNLVVGGSGKTPTVAALVRILQDMGEHPAILSRGYGRRGHEVVIVSDGHGPRVDVLTSGDEPQMLARLNPTTPIVVGADRYVTGRLAESRLDATVHVLDDGFQHVRLARDVDLLLVSASDLDEALLPAGRLREPLDAASKADAILVMGSADERARVQAALGATTVFEMTPDRASLKSVKPFGVDVATEERKTVAVAGIARPERFLASLTASGFDIAEAVTFDDHHWFSADDVAHIVEVAQKANTSLIVTTEKDAVRLEPHLARHGTMLRWTYQPYGVRFEPDMAFRAWLTTRLDAARNRIGGAT